MVDVEIKSPCILYIYECFLDYRQCLQTQKVHFDKPGILDDASLILSGDHFRAVGVVGHRYGNPVRYVVAADNHAAGVDAGSTDITLQLLGIFHGLADTLVLAVGLCLKFLAVFKKILEIDLYRVPIVIVKPVGDETRKAVGFRQRHFKHFGDILYRHFCRHALVSDDMGYFFSSVFLRYIFEHLIATVVIEIDVDIRERDSVGIQEPLEQKVVFHGVHLCNAEAVCYSRASCVPS